MFEKLFLLVVACASFVHGDWFPGGMGLRTHLDTPNERSLNVVTKTNHFVDVLKSGIQSKSGVFDYATEEDLEDVIDHGLKVADYILELGIKFSKIEWTISSERGQIMAKNSTEYTARAEADKGRFKKALVEAADNVRNEARRLTILDVASECIDRVVERTRKDFETPLATFVAEIWHLNFQYNSTYPQFPFLMLEEVLKSEYKERIKSIKNCGDRISVEAELEKYAGVMRDRYNSFMNTTAAVNDFFFKHQIEVYKKYMETNRKIEKIYLTAFGNIRKCLDVKEVLQQRENGY